MARSNAASCCHSSGEGGCGRCANMSLRACSKKWRLTAASATPRSVSPTTLVSAWAASSSSPVGRMPG